MITTYFSAEQLTPLVRVTIYGDAAAPYHYDVRLRVRRRPKRGRRTATRTTPRRTATACAPLTRRPTTYRNSQHTTAYCDNVQETPLRDPSNTLKATVVAAGLSTGSSTCRLPLPGISDQPPAALLCVPRCLVVRACRVGALVHENQVRDRDVRAFGVATIKLACEKRNPHGFFHLVLILEYDVASPRASSVSATLSCSSARFSVCVPTGLIVTYSAPIDTSRERRAREVQ